MKKSEVEIGGFYSWWWGGQSGEPRIVQVIDRCEDLPAGLFVVRSKNRPGIMITWHEYLHPLSPLEQLALALE